MEQEADYKEMYLKMVRATEQAINLLIQAQQACEELYLAGGETDADVRDAYMRPLQSRTEHLL